MAHASVNDWMMLLVHICGVWGCWRSRGNGQVCVAVWISDSIFWLIYILPPHWLVGVMPCPRKSKKNYTKEKTETDKRQRRFPHTFPYLLGSTTIPWMKEFFLDTLKWLNPQLRRQKYVRLFHVCICPHLVFRASIRVGFLLEVCHSLVRVSFIVHLWVLYISA